jgi:flagellar biogenesis protein FliO
VTPFFLAVDGAAISFAGDPTPLTARAVMAAVVVVGLMGLAAWMLRRHAPIGRGRQAVAVESAVALGERRSLVIVTVEGRRLLLGLTPASVGLITELTPPATQDGTSFAQALDATLPQGPRS